MNCSAIPEQLLEAEFFGYRKGAFTGAMEDREGFFQAANGGTLFLDEIGDLPLPMQSKLLRVIQERSVRPVGAVAEVPVNVRLLSATHKDLAAEVQAGRFRQDLYYRLNVIQIRVPPLRERLEDLVVDQRARAGAHRARCGRLAAAAPDARGAGAPARATPSRATCASSRTCCTARWRCRAAKPSTSTISGCRTTVFTDSAAQELDLITGNTRVDVMQVVRELAPPVPIEVPLPDDLGGYLDEVERDILVRALERHRFNRTAAGASLGLSLRQMRYRMARLGVHVGGDGADRE